MRTDNGVGVGLLPSAAAPAVDAAVQAGLLEFAEPPGVPSTRLRLTAPGRLLAAELAVRLAE